MGLRSQAIRTNKLVANSRNFLVPGEATTSLQRTEMMMFLATVEMTSFKAVQVTISFLVMPEMMIFMGEMVMISSTVAAVTIGSGEVLVRIGSLLT